MKTRLFLVLVALSLGGCALFRVPRTRPSQQQEAWASDMVRQQNKADRQQIDEGVKKDKAAQPLEGR